MAETKKRLYSRKTVAKHYRNFTIQMEDFNELNFPDKLMDVVIFGSYINTDNQKIHDLDIGIRLEKHTDLYESYIADMSEAQKKRYSNTNFTNKLYAPYFEEIRFLKAKMSTISIHDIQNDSEAIFKDKYLYIMKDGIILEEAMVSLFEK